MSDQLAHPERISSHLSELRPFFDFCQQLDDLRNYTVLNYIGVLKICKKYDKKTEVDFKHSFQPVLTRQPFYTSTVLAVLFTEVQCLCAQLVWHTNKVAPSAQDFTCPIWYAMTAICDTEGRGWGDLIFALLTSSRPRARSARRS